MCDVLVGLLKDKVPVFDAPRESTDVDIVDGVIVPGPWQLAVIDFEPAVWRDLGVG